MTSLAELVSMFQVLTLIDLTSLKENDDDLSISSLCRKAQTALGNVAAVCVLPRFVGLAKQLLRDSSIPVATVANFPSGQQPIDATLEEIAQALKDGADEIDVVMPYHLLGQGKENEIQTYLKHCREHISAPAKMKVIIESGELAETEIIRQAAEMAVQSGAQFVKTSTGKTAVGATPEAVRVILEVLQHHPRHPCGIKISGGVKSVSKASEYLNIVRNIMSSEWISKDHVRFGASQLLDEILDS